MIFAAQLIKKVVMVSVVQVYKTFREGHSDSLVSAVNGDYKVWMEGYVNLPAFDCGHSNNLAGVLHDIIYYA